MGFRDPIVHSPSPPQGECLRIKPVHSHRPPLPGRPCGLLLQLFGKRIGTQSCRDLGPPKSPFARTGVYNNQMATNGRVGQQPKMNNPGPQPQGPWLRLHNWCQGQGFHLSRYEWRLGPDHAPTWHSVCISPFHFSPRFLLDSHI